MADFPHREKDCWCSETGSSEEHEWISNCTHNESQEVLQMKMGCSTADGALRNFSELGLVYHESGRRKLLAEYQKDGNASRSQDVAKIVSPKPGCCEIVLPKPGCCESQDVAKLFCLSQDAAKARMLRNCFA